MFSRRIPDSDGPFLYFFIITSAILSSGLIWLLIHPSMILIHDNTVKVYKDFFRVYVFKKDELLKIKTSSWTFHTAEIIFRDGRSPLIISLWDTSEKSFKKLGAELRITVD